MSIKLLFPKNSFFSNSNFLVPKINSFSTAQVFLCQSCNNSMMKIKATNSFICFSCKTYHSDKNYLIHIGKESFSKKLLPSSKNSNNNNNGNSNNLQPYFLRKKNHIRISSGEPRIDYISSALENANSFESEYEYSRNRNFVFNSPMQLYTYLNQYVVEQYQAKKILSVALYNHYCRFNFNKQKYTKILDNPNSEHVSLEKSNILLLGPSGSGKTLLARTITNFLSVPFAMSDATSLTQAGYVGEDVESILFRLVQNADFDLEKAQRGIVFIDEIDKIAKRKGGLHPSGGRDVAGEGVQQALLKLLEGSIVDIPNKAASKHMKAETISLDTSNILFILSGAFVDLPNIIKERLTRKNSKFGFSTDNSSDDSTLENRNTSDHPKISDENMLDHIENSDLVDFGLIPEFIGRAPIVASLNELSEEALVSALTETKNCLISQYQTLFKINNIDLKFTRDAILSIAAKAKEKKVGARGLRSILEFILLPAMFEAPGTNVKKVIIDELVVKGKKKPIMV